MTKKSNDISLYYNDRVIDFLDRVCKVKVFKGGRASGKTRGIPEDMLDRARNLPGSRHFLLSLTFEAIDSNIMPDVHEVFQLHGLKPGIHYVVDKVPPKHFAKSKKPLVDYSHSVCLFDGTCFQKISMGRMPKKNRGRSYDGGIIDEALNLDGWAVRNIILPTIRGINYWKGTPGGRWWKMLSVYSSHPRTPEGSWFMVYEKLAQLNPIEYAWVEATAYDNIAVVGEDYIEDLRKSMSYVDFQIEVMNKGTIKNKPTLFYYQHDQAKHHYVAEGLADVDKDLELELSFDFGGRYSCMTVTQEQGQKEKVVHEFDTNTMSEEDRTSGKAKKIPDIVRDFCLVFKGHRNKHVRIWGDRTGLNPNEMDDSTIYDKIKEILEQEGWTVEVMVSYSDSALHKSRYNFMNDVFEESIIDYPRIQINALTCPNLIVSLDTTRVTDDFKKDKKDERNPRFNQSYAPHLTDTLDYKFFNKYLYLLDDDYTGSSYSGIDGGIEAF
ncbi:MAG: hypothetical protein AAFP77_19750 [Bacteroidota bacterium]